MADFVLGPLSATMQKGGGGDTKRELLGCVWAESGPDIFNLATLKGSAPQPLLSVNSKDDF